jgi:O-antigen/teichoic acid export membrane protein
MIRQLAYSSVSAGSAALLLLLMIAAGRVLGDVEFGKFAFALLLGGVFETLMDFGLHQVTVRAVARDRSRATALLQHALAIKLVWATLTVGVLVMTANMLRPQHDVRVACYLIGGSLVFRSYMLTIRGVLQGLEQFGWDSLIVLADRGLMLGLGLAALRAGFGLRGLTAAFVVARGAALLLAAAVTHARLGSLGLRYDREVWLDLHRAALPLGLFLVVLNLYSYIDGVMLGYLRTDAETGLYAAAYKVYEGLTYAPLAISTVLTPKLSALFATDGRAHVRMALRGVSGTAALGVVVAGVAYAVATPLLVFLFGAEFGAATSPFRILSLGLPVVYAIWILHAIAISVDRERLLLRTGLVGLTVNVGINLYAIPHFGPDGAAFATVAGEVVSMGMLIAGLAVRRVPQGVA